MKLTKKRAFELSIEKWEWIVKNYGDDYGLTDELKHMKLLWSTCGLCEWSRGCFGGVRCDRCPISGGGDGLRNGCDDIYHEWKMWAFDKSKANAQAVLDLIKEKYEEHLKRYKL